MCVRVSVLSVCVCVCVYDLGFDAATGDDDDNDDDVGCALRCLAECDARAARYVVAYVLQRAAVWC